MRIMGDWHVSVEGLVNNHSYWYIYSSVPLTHFLILLIPLCLLESHTSCKTELKRRLQVGSSSQSLPPED